MKIFVYALKSIEFNFIYVGMTNNLDRRIQEHNSKLNTSTKPYAPLFLFHWETFENRTEARKREKCLKAGSGKEFLKNQLRIFLKKS
jgi:putative endonuclease